MKNAELTVAPSHPTLVQEVTLPHFGGGFFLHSRKEEKSKCLGVTRKHTGKKKILKNGLV